MSKKNGVQYITAAERADLLADIETMKQETTGTLSGVASSLGEPVATIYWINRNKITVRTAERIRKSIGRWRARHATDGAAKTKTAAIEKHVATVPALPMSTTTAASVRVTARMLAEYRSGEPIAAGDFLERARALVRCWEHDAIRLVLTAAEDDHLPSLGEIGRAVG